MKTRILDSPSTRIPLAIAVLALVVVVAGAIYYFSGNSNAAPVNGPKIVAAAHAYTRVLIQNHAPVPPSVPLQTLVDQNYLKPEDIGSLQGLDAKIYLIAFGHGPEIIMSVKMPDGTNFVLLGNGSSKKVKP